MKASNSNSARSRGDMQLHLSQISLYRSLLQMPLIESYDTRAHLQAELDAGAELDLLGVKIIVLEEVAEGFVVELSLL